MQCHVFVTVFVVRRCCWYYLCQRKTLTGTHILDACQKALTTVFRSFADSNTSEFRIRIVYYSIAVLFYPVYSEDKNLHTKIEEYLNEMNAKERKNEYILLHILPIWWDRERKIVRLGEKKYTAKLGMVVLLNVPKRWHRCGWFVRVSVRWITNRFYTFSFDEFLIKNSLRGGN